MVSRESPVEMASRDTLAPLNWPDHRSQIVEGPYIRWEKSCPQIEGTELMYTDLQVGCSQKKVVNFTHAR